MIDLTPEAIGEKLAEIAFLVEAGEISPRVGTAVANIWSKALYSLQIEYQRDNNPKVVIEELSDADKARLDELAKILGGKHDKA